jgi:hypothetical protein
MDNFCICYVVPGDNPACPMAETHASRDLHLDIHIELHESMIRLSTTFLLAFSQPLSRVIVSDFVSALRKMQVEGMDDLEELVDDFIHHTGKRPTNTMTSELYDWSYAQTFTAQEG